MQPRQIDTAALKAAFRQRAHQLGIDPAAGSTSYQAANVKAEVAKRTHRQRMAALCDTHAVTLDTATLMEARHKRDWWRVVGMWEDEEYIDKSHPFETVFFRAFDEKVRRELDRHPIQSDLLTGGYRELVSALWMEARDEIALRDLLARRGVMLAHVPLGKGRVHAVEVPLSVS